MRFKAWMESVRRNKILILVHPDCAGELGVESGRRYVDLIRQHASRFDFVITHSFTSSLEWIDRSTYDEPHKQVYRDLYETAKSVSNHFLYNPRDLHSPSYDKELPEYLINNPESDIYMGGGYESNCVWLGYQLLFQKLRWLLEESGVKVTYYTPLLFGTRHNGGLERSNSYESWPRYAGDFHPSKVQYSDELPN